MNKPDMNTTATNTIKERLADLYEYVHRSLGFVEAKNGALAALNSGIIIGVLTLWAKGQNCWLYFGFLLPVISSLFLVLLSFYPLNSSKEKKKSKKDSKNLFSCENISLLSFDAFKSLISEKQEITFFEIDKMEHIYHTAIVASRKYKLFRWALVILSLSPVSLLIAYLFTLN